MLSLFQHDLDFEKVLLAEERNLIEFRAIGGQVQIVNLLIFCICFSDSLLNYPFVQYRLSCQ